MDLSVFESIVNETDDVLLQFDQSHNADDTFGFWIEGVLLVSFHYLKVYDISCLIVLYKLE